MPGDAIVEDNRRFRLKSTFRQFETLAECKQALRQADRIENYQPVPQFERYMEDGILDYRDVHQRMISGQTLAGGERRRAGVKDKKVSS